MSWLPGDVTMTLGTKLTLIFITVLSNLFKEMTSRVNLQSYIELVLLAEPNFYFIHQV